jgi:hypothetical protein
VQLRRRPYIRTARGSSRRRDGEGAQESVAKGALRFFARPQARDHREAGREARLREEAREERERGLHVSGRAVPRLGRNEHHLRGINPATAFYKRNKILAT